MNTRRLSQSRLLTGRLRPTNNTTQNAFNWLDPDFSIRSGRSVEQRSPNFLTTWTPFLARVQLPARYGFCRPPPRRYPSTVLHYAQRFWHRSERAAQGTVPLTNLCSRFVVTSTPRTLNSRARRLSPLDRRRPGYPAAHTLVYVLEQRETPSTLVDPKASPAPSGAAIGVACTSCDRDSTTREG